MSDFILNLSNIQKFLIFPETRFIISINSKLIFLLFKLWYLFNIKRSLVLLLKKNFFNIYILKFKYFNLIKLIIIKINIKFKLKIFRERYKSKCPRFILRQQNLRFSVMRYSYRKYYLLKHYFFKELPFYTCLHYYHKYFIYEDFMYGTLLLIYVLIVFSVTIYLSLLYVIAADVAFNNYFYNSNAWVRT